MRTPLEVTVEHGAEATMRDGTVLRADLYRPRGAGPWPVLLARTPYGTRDPAVLSRLDPARAAARGFLVVVQDCRGRFASAGVWAPLVHEADDGYDTVAWAAGLPGADGRVAMYGPSYLGQVQWAAIGAGAPALCASVAEFTWSDPYDGLVTRGGAYELGLVTQWTLALGFDVLERRFADQPSELRRQLAALTDAVEHSAAYREAARGEAPVLRRLGLPVPAPRPGPAAVPGIPTLTVAGWFDAFLQGSLDNHVRAREAGMAAALIVGPWTHGNQGRVVGERDFGASADGGSLLDRELDWLEGTLSVAERGAEPPVRLFVMGIDAWRDFEAWPPDSVEVPWFLHAEGGLSLIPPASGSVPDSVRDLPPDSPPSSFRHDPEEPVPTRGGAVLLPDGFADGPCDQREIEARDDVLVYTSAPLTEPMAVIGRIRVHLVAASTATESDWVVRLCDVDLDGTSRNLADGVVRVLQADRIAEHVIDLWSTAHVFLPGHCLRVQVASSCFPRWDRMPEARQRVFHDPARPSRIVLPAVAMAEL